MPSSSGLEIDANGSPVTIRAADWFVCFVPGLKPQWWHRFASAKHKHVFALRRVDDDRWLLVEPWWTRLMVNVLTADQAQKFLRWAAAGDTLKVREAIPGRGSQMRGWTNCAVLVAFLLGRSYWTWTPHGLYRKLKAEVDSESVNLAQLLGVHSGKAVDTPADESLDLQPDCQPQGATRVPLGQWNFGRICSTRWCRPINMPVSDCGLPP